MYLLFSICNLIAQNFGQTWKSQFRFISLPSAKKTNANSKHWTVQSKTVNTQIISFNELNAARATSNDYINILWISTLVFAVNFGGFIPFFQRKNLCWIIKRSGFTIPGMNVSNKLCMTNDNSNSVYRQCWWICLPCAFNVFINFIFDKM